jgi:hypothetical protein
LWTVISVRLVHADLLARRVGVVARADAGADDDADPRRVFTNPLDEFDPATVDLGQRFRAVPEQLAPVRARTPRRRVEDETDSAGLRQLDIRCEVLAERFDAFTAVEQRERCEVRELEAALMDEPSLHAAVREEEVAGELRQHQPPSL